MRPTTYPLRTYVAGPWLFASEGERGLARQLLSGNMLSRDDV